MMIISRMSMEVIVTIVRKLGKLSPMGLTNNLLILGWNNLVTKYQQDIPVILGGFLVAQHLLFLLGDKNLGSDPGSLNRFRNVEHFDPLERIHGTRMYI